MSKPRLFFLSHTHQYLGGGERSSMEIIRQAIEHGFEVSVIVPKDGEYKRRAEAIGANAQIIKSYWWTSNGNNEFHPAQNKNAIKEIRKLLSEVKPDLCITNTITNPWLAYAAYLEGFPHAWIIREYGDLDHQLKFWLPKSQVCKIISDLSVAVFVNSQSLYEHYKPLIKKPIKILYPLIKAPVVNKTISPFSTDGLKVVCVGSISPGKGQLDAVKAIERLVKQDQKAQLLLIGSVADQHYAQTIKEYVDSNLLGNAVRLVGQIESPADFVAHADVSVVCSKSEAFGRVTIESILTGTPVVGAKNAGTQEILGSENDFLYMHGDSTELAKKIARFSDAAYRQSILSSQKQTVSSKYSPETVNNPLFEVIKPGLGLGLKPNASYEPLETILDSQKNLRWLKKILLLLRAIRAKLV